MNRLSWKCLSDRRGGGGSFVLDDPSGGCPMVGLRRLRLGLRLRLCYSPCYSRVGLLLACYRTGTWAGVLVRSDGCCSALSVVW